MAWAVFLDRDGVIVEERGLIVRAEDLHILPGVAAGIRRLRQIGARIILTTNQPVVARGLIDEEGLRQLHARLEENLARDGATFDAIYYCPHHPETHHVDSTNPKYRRVCSCRKPAPGMLQDAARYFDVDLDQSFMIGDSTRDIQTARNAGCRAVLVRTGNAGQDGLFAVEPDVICDDLAAAAEWIALQVGSAREIL